MSVQFLRLPPLVLAAACAGCVSLPPGEAGHEPPGARVTPGDAFPGLDPGAKELASLHFNVRAYGSERAREAADLAESLYNRIMADTGLYSFKPPGLYSIVVYGGREEFLRKTGQPEWSAGLAAGNAVYGYDGPALAPVLAHEMTHLIFHEFMGPGRRDSPELRWINEGLAVYEEFSGSALGGAPSGWSPEQRYLLKSRPIPFDQMAALVPATERERAVGLWYQQVGDVLRFLIERGGRNGVGQFLSALRRGRSQDEAIRESFPGLWGGLRELEAAWRAGL